MYKNITFSLVMITVVSLAIWTTILSMRPSTIVNVDMKSFPDAVMEEVSALVLDKQGKPKMEIVTPKMVHYLENDTTHLSSPKLTLYRKSPQPWVITANSGKATAGVENLYFQDNVIIHHPADGSHPATLIKTNDLLVHPNAQTAETLSLITLIQPSLVIKAIGMHADMTSGDIKLLSQARGEYVPGS